MLGVIGCSIRENNRITSYNVCYTKLLRIPDNFEIYKPVFHVKVVWLIAMGVFILLKGINLSKLES